MSGQGQLTGDLDAWRAGDGEAAERVMDRVYSELRDLGRRFMANERAGHTLQATGLANEAILKLLPQETVFANRAHFFWAASRAMRRILADHARKKMAAKRGADMNRVALEVEPGEESWLTPDRLALHQAITLLETLNARHARVVDYKIYGGFTNREVAEFLGVDIKTVERDFTIAKGWLKRKLAPAAGS